jgi:hypothetical protein
MKGSISSKTTDRLEFECDLWSREFTLVAGVDEAGRGPLAGPVVAAAVSGCSVRHLA